MKDVRLRAVCFWIAAFAGAVVLGSLVFPAVRLIVLPATILMSGTVDFLFFRILFSPTIRQGVNAARREVQGRDSWINVRDPVWGIFGSRTGSPALLWLRAVLVIGILPIGLFQNWIGMDVVLLWLAGSLVAVELGIMHAALSKSDGDLIS